VSLQPRCPSSASLVLPLFALASHRPAPERRLSGGRGAVFVPRATLLRSRHASIHAARTRDRSRASLLPSQGRASRLLPSLSERICCVIRESAPLVSFVSVWRCSVRAVREETRAALANRAALDWERRSGKSAACRIRGVNALARGARRTAATECVPLTTPRSLARHCHPRRRTACSLIGTTRGGTSYMARGSCVEERSVRAWQMTRRAQSRTIASRGQSA
jgi:hypothetical protein